MSVPFAGYGWSEFSTLYYTELVTKEQTANHEFGERIVRDRKICGGEPVFRGTRVTLKTVLASLAEGDAVEEILADFPTLTAEDIQAAIRFAAASAEEDLPAPALPNL